MTRDIKSFVRFSVWVGLAMAFFVAVMSFVNRRFSSGPVAPVGQAAGWLGRASTGR